MNMSLTSSAIEARVSAVLSEFLIDDQAGASPAGATDVSWPAKNIPS
ncbi:hypothetical protein G9444_6713 (plasmid) [Rhodococcus erythropolis]|jgi:hypothetical protein|uniref:Uncharacterized protein n=1 Tax=Rhodococcus erythropolis TaxID=1833 RepID=A0A6G9D4R7_RHOER|nr:hypothetical protein G9444_6713 [Rhodococcus erythropolis]